MQNYKGTRLTAQAGLDADRATAIYDGSVLLRKLVILPALPSALRRNAIRGMSRAELAETIVAFDLFVGQVDIVPTALVVVANAMRRVREWPGRTAGMLLTV